MKILFTVTTDLNHDQRMQRICTSLQLNGYDILLVGRQKKSSSPLSSQVYGQKRIKCFFESSILFYLEYNIRLFFFLCFSKFDVVSSVDLDTVLPAYMVYRLRRKQIVFDAHEYFTELPELEARPLVKKVWTAIANICLPNIPIAYTVNKSLAHIFAKKYNVNYGYIRSITKYRGDNKVECLSKERIILYQGALNVGRGLEIAIRAMLSIDNARLEIAGDGDLKESLVALVVSLKLQDKVVFLGNLPPDELAKKTNEAYIGLNLLASNSLNYYYSLANKFFDYMHAGVPSINMNFPEYKYINDQDEVSILLSELTEIHLVKAIDLLLDDVYLYGKLSRNSISASEKYRWEIEEEKLVKIYEKTLT